MNQASPEERVRQAVRTLLDRGEQPSQRRVQELAHCRAATALAAIRAVEQANGAESTSDAAAARAEAPSPGGRRVAGRSPTADPEATDDPVGSQPLDSLTGLPTRRAAEGFLDHELAHAEEQHGALTVLFFDVDGLKELNDRLGHEAGDGLLRRMGTALRAVARSADLAVRWGGDEFVVILPGADESAAQRIVERVRKADVDLIWSVGAASRQPGDDPASILDRADQAMYQQKKEHHAKPAPVRPDAPPDIPTEAPAPQDPHVPVPEKELARMRERFGDGAVDEALDALMRQGPERIQNPGAWVYSVARRLAARPADADAQPDTTAQPADPAGQSARSPQPETGSRPDGGAALFSEPAAAARRAIEDRTKPSAAPASPDGPPAPGPAGRAGVETDRALPNSVAALLTTENSQAVAAALRRPAPQTRIASRGQGPREIAELALVPCDLFIVDVNTGPMLGPALRRYRVSRPQTRIVLLAPGREPGDREVSQVVVNGIHDVVTDPEKLEEAIRHPADFTAAARWITDGEESERERQARAGIWRERVVERRVPLRQHPALIAVVGTGGGVGTTTVACALAGYTARLGYDCALVETSGSSVVPGQPSFELASEYAPGEQWLPHVAVWPDSYPSLLTDLLRARQVPYIVGDVGCLAAEEVAELRADLTILVLPPQVHRWAHMVRWLYAHGKRLPTLRSDAQLTLEEKKRLWAEREAAEAADRQAIAALEHLQPGLCAVVPAYERNWRQIALTWNALWSIPGRTEMPVFGLRVAAGWPPGYSKPDAGQDADLANLLDPLLVDPAPRSGPLGGLLRRFRRGESLTGKDAESGDDHES